MTGLRTPWRDLAVVVLAPVVVLALALGLWWQAGQAQVRADAAEDRLAHALSRPARAPEAEAVALLVPGATVGLAGSALQALVLAAVQPSGVQVSEVTMGGAVDEAPLTRLGLTLQITGSEPQIVTALLALEGAVPLVRVDRLDVQSAGEGFGLAATLVLSAWAGQVAP